MHLLHMVVNVQAFHQVLSTLYWSLTQAQNVAPRGHPKAQTSLGMDALSDVGDAGLV